MKVLKLFFCRAAGYWH